MNVILYNLSIVLMQQPVAFSFCTNCDCGKRK